jgi:hypothetical protein
MDNTMLIQLTNHKAIGLLHELEALDLIKVLTTTTTQPLSEKYAGKLPSDIADKLQNYVAQSRNEWDR